jgi:nitrate/TMAO reductase-like tetraheme cytochrome c subunit
MHTILEGESAYCKRCHDADQTTIAELRAEADRLEDHIVTPENDLEEAEAEAEAREVTP